MSYRPRPTAEDIDAQAELKIHVSNFKRLVNITAELQGALIQAMIERFGVSLDVSPGHIFSNHCQVMDAGSGEVFVKAGCAIDTEYRYIRIPEDTDHYTLPAIDTLYNVLLKYAQTRNELGTIDVTALSLTLVGTDTEFTDVFKSPGGDLIRISGSTLGNNGDYIVDSVADDTHFDVAATDIDGNAVSFTTETGLIYQYLGDYDQVYGGVPPAELRIYLHDFFEIEIRLASSGYTEGTELILAEVTKDAGDVVTIIDRRYRNVLRLRHIGDADLGEVLAPPTPGLIRIETGGCEISVEDAGLATGFSGLLARGAGATRTLRSAYFRVHFGWEIPSSRATVYLHAGHYRIKDSGVGTELAKFPHLGLTSWDTDYWKEQDHVLIDSEGNVYEILANGADYVEVAIQPVSGDFWITPNADYYEALFTPVRYLTGAELGADATQTQIHHSESPVKMLCYQTVFAGVQYKVDIRSVRNNVKSQYHSPGNFIAGNLGQPTTIPTIKLGHPTDATTTTDYKGITNLAITNHSDCIAGSPITIPPTVPPTTVPVGAVGYEVFVKHKGATSITDYPDTTDQYFFMNLFSDECVIPAQDLHTNSRYLTVTVRAISATGQFGPVAQDGKESGFYSTMEEQAEGDPRYRPGRTPTDVVGELADMESNQQGSIMTIINNQICGAIQDCRDVCCAGGVSPAAETEVEVTQDMHYINIIRPGAIAYGTFWTTALGKRYGVDISQARLSNEDSGDGSALLEILSDTSAQLALPATEFAIDNMALGPVQKAAASIVTLRALKTGLRNPRIRLGFRISSFGKFKEMGETTDEHYETLFQFAGKLTTDQDVETEEGIDYSGQFVAKHFGIILQHPPLGGDITIHIGNEKSDLGSYIEFIIPDGDTGITDFANELVITDPKQLWCRVIGAANNAGYLQVYCTIAQGRVISGSYPYDYGPHWFTHIYYGKDVGGTQRLIRRFAQQMECPWCEIHLPTPATSVCKFKVTTGSAQAGEIEIEIPVGAIRNDNVGEIAIPASGNLYVEVLSGTPRNYITLVEVHRK